MSFDLQVVAGAGQVETDRIRVRDQEDEVELGALEIDLRKSGFLERKGRPLERRGAGLTQERASEKQRQEQQ